MIVALECQTQDARRPERRLDQAQHGHSHRGGGVGLLGVTCLMAIQLTKEIGASVSNIAALRSRDFVQLVLIAFPTGGAACLVTREPMDAALRFPHWHPLVDLPLANPMKFLGTE